MSHVQCTSLRMVLVDFNGLQPPCRSVVCDILVRAPNLFLAVGLAESMRYLKKIDSKLVTEHVLSLSENSFIQYRTIINYLSQRL